MSPQEWKVIKKLVEYGRDEAPWHSEPDWPDGIDWVQVDEIIIKLDALIAWETA